MQFILGEDETPQCNVKRHFIASSANFVHVELLQLQDKYEYSIPLEKDECTKFNYSIKVSIKQAKLLGLIVL